MKDKHKNFKLCEVGFCISTEQPEFGASVDGMISCDCCGEACVEIKCPYKLQKMENKIYTLKDFAEMKDSYLILNADGTFQLAQNHAYYYQIQLHMYALDKKFCDFIIWCPDFCLIMRLSRDEPFLLEKLTKARQFYHHVIKPELLSRCYTEPSKDVVEIEMFCYCCTDKKDEEIIQCANKECEIKLFHLSCTNFLNFEERGWTCDLCIGNEIQS